MGNKHRIDAYRTAQENERQRHDGAQLAGARAGDMKLEPSKADPKAFLQRRLSRNDGRQSADCKADPKTSHQPTF